MRSVLTSWLARAAGLALLFSVLASGAFAQTTAWDQKAVTAIGSNSAAITISTTDPTERQATR